EEVDDEANIIFGSAIDETLHGRIRVSVVATGIDTPAAAQAERPRLVAVGGGMAAVAAVGGPAMMPGGAMASPGGSAVAGYGGGPGGHGAHGAHAAHGGHAAHHPTLGAAGATSAAGPAGGPQLNFPRVASADMMT